MPSTSLNGPNIVTTLLALRHRNAHHISQIILAFWTDRNLCQILPQPCTIRNTWIQLTRLISVQVYSQLLQQCPEFRLRHCAEYDQSPGIITLNG